MKLQSHILAGAVGTAVLYPILGPGKSLLFFTASVLIDTDHYIEYLWRIKFKDRSPKRMFRYFDNVTIHKKDKDNLGFSLFHTIEIFLVVYFIGIHFFPSLFVPIFLGMLYHMVFDILWLTYHKVPTVRAFSIIEYFIRKNFMIRKGNDPKFFYEKMFKLLEKK